MTTNVIEYFFYSTDSDSHAEFDALITSQPETSIRIYFDDELILEHIKE